MLAHHPGYALLPEQEIAEFSLSGSHITGAGAAVLDVVFAYGREEDTACFAVRDAEGAELFIT